MHDLETWIRQLYREPDLLGMGHAQSRDDLNLGLGWLYYAFVRLQRARRVVVIGSYRGFAPMVFARALQDNGNGGQVSFIDPSRVDEFWRQPAEVRAHFARFGLDNIRHHLHTTQDFVNTPDYAALSDIDLLFVDGYHTHEQAKFDHLAFQGKLAPQGLVLFHDSVRTRDSRIYGEDKRYRHTVVHYMDELKAQSELQVMDFASDSGLTLVKRPL